MSIGSKLRIFGEEKFGNLANLARALGVKQASLYNYLNDESIPGGALLQKLLILGCDINWLLSEDKRLEDENKDDKRSGSEEKKLEVIRAIDLEDRSTFSSINKEEFERIIDDIITKINNNPDLLLQLNSTMDFYIEFKKTMEKTILHNLGGMSLKEPGE